MAKVDLTGYIGSKFAGQLYKIIDASFSMDSGISFNWHFNQSEIKPEPYL